MSNHKLADGERSKDVAVRLEEVSQRFKTLQLEAGSIALVATVLIDCFKAGNKVIFCGNGGSAADSQHLAAEFMGRYLRDRRPLPSMSLTVDTSALTAIANDYGYDHVFSRQLRGVGKAGDVLVGVSTSGNSKNVVNAFMVAKELGITTIALTGQGGGKLGAMADFSVQVPSRQTNEIQEMHIVIGHMLCGYVEAEVC